MVYENKNNLHNTKFPHKLRVRNEVELGSSVKYNPGMLNSERNVSEFGDKYFGRNAFVKLRPSVATDRISDLATIVTMLAALKSCYVRL